MIDIIIMTRNDNDHLKSCVEAIRKHTKLEYKLHIVDNASNNVEHNKYLKHCARDDINIVYNTKNEWVLGCNKLLSELRLKSKSKYFVLTDGDIVVPDNGVGPCWLEYLKNTMDRYSCIGKLGMSLDSTFLESEPSLKNILMQENDLYDEGRKIGDLYISPVDTTLAMYRWDWSLQNNFKFYPYHMSYIRPELYSCRTPRYINVKHLGWEKYSKPDNVADINAKVLCFTKFAADVKRNQLIHARLLIRIFHFFLKYPYKIKWKARRLMVGVLDFLFIRLSKYDNT